MRERNSDVNKRRTESSDSATKVDDKKRSRSSNNNNQGSKSNRDRRRPSRGKNNNHLRAVERNNHPVDLVINYEPWEIRVAYLENGRLTELYVERQSERQVVGNIYLGKVVRVLPGMQAAFVDIGLERTGFLYVSELLGSDDELNQLLDSEEDELEISQVASRQKSKRIEEQLKEGQDILVQVTKAPMGTKGARLTCNITLPGRWLVLMPTMNHVGVSRRIPEAQERKRLRSIVDKVRKKGEGMIVRTVCDGQPGQSIIDDANYLNELWDKIKKDMAKKKPPKLIYSDLNLAARAVRDLLNDNVKNIHIDNREVYEELGQFIKSFSRGKKSVLKYYNESTPIFEKFDLEAEIKRLREKKVWLKSGGYLIIEQTEALFAIDVNTGRFVGKKSFDETILQTNLEAAEEIVHQIRFRDIGGIIILDFIDMDRAADREKVYRKLEEALRADKARTNISKITSLGLVEMTRKRTQENITQAHTEPCEYCLGRGRIKSEVSTCYELFRAIIREAQFIKNDTINVNLHPKVARHVLGEELDRLRSIEERIQKKIRIHRDSAMHQEAFEIHG